MDTVNVNPPIEEILRQINNSDEICGNKTYKSIKIKI